MNTDLFTSIAQNALFVLEFLGIVVAIIIIAYLVELAAKKKSGSTERILTTKKMVVIGMFSAIATLLFLLEFPLPFLAPGFYEMDFSELPALIAGFAYGPVAGVMVEFLKILIKLAIKGTSTAFVGDLANFVIGCALILPASICYSFKKNKKMAILSCVIGTIVIAGFGSIFNALYLLPAFSKVYGMDLAVIVEAGTQINPLITSPWTMALWAVLPFNLIKGTVDSVITMLVYKPLRKFLK